MSPDFLPWRPQHPPWNGSPGPPSSLCRPGPFLSTVRPLSVKVGSGAKPGLPLAPVKGSNGCAFLLTVCYVTEDGERREPRGISGVWEAPGTPEA